MCTGEVNLSTQQQLLVDVAGQPWLPLQAMLVRPQHSSNLRSRGDMATEDGVQRTGSFQVYVLVEVPVVVWKLGVVGVCAETHPLDWLSLQGKSKSVYSDRAYYVR